jgi:hypothetical protein
MPLYQIARRLRLSDPAAPPRDASSRRGRRVALLYFHESRPTLRALLKSDMAANDDV